MKTKIAIAAALAACLASPAFAAPPKHHAATDHDTMGPYGQGTYQEYGSPRSDVVTYGDRVIGQDPDPNIRAQLRHDPVPSEY